jgi:hypothetical protein
MTAPSKTNAESTVATSRRGHRWARPLGTAGATALLALATVAAGTGAASAAPRASAAKAPVVHESLVVLSGDMVGNKDWPEFVDSANIQWPAGTTVVLTIYSYDDGSTPLTKPLSVYDAVMGTVGNSELVDGKKVSSVPNADIAHTFTVPSVGLNIPIPVAPTAKKGELRTPEVVTATFRVNKTGTFTWHCYAPCGTGSGGTQGSMAKNGWMTGNVTFG